MTVIKGDVEGAIREMFNPVFPSPLRENIVTYLTPVLEIIGPCEMMIDSLDFKLISQSDVGLWFNSSLCIPVRENQLNAFQVAYLTGLTSSIICKVNTPVGKFGMLANNILNSGRGVLTLTISVGKYINNHAKGDLAIGINIDQDEEKIIHEVMKKKGLI